MTTTGNKGQSPYEFDSTAPSEPIEQMIRRINEADPMVEPTPEEWAAVLGECDRLRAKLVDTDERYHTNYAELEERYREARTEVERAKEELSHAIEKIEQEQSHSRRLVIKHGKERDALRGYLEEMGYDPKSFDRWCALREKGQGGGSDGEQE